MRSLLRVRAETAGTLDRALRSGADALVLDLQDDDTQASTASSRALALAFLRAAQFEAHRPLIYIRLPAIDAASIDEDLAAIVLGEPDGFVLGRCHAGRDVQHLGAKLAVHEAEYGLTDGEGAIIAETGAAAQSLFALGSYGGASARLLGLAWDAAAFAADLGGDLCRTADGGHAEPVVTARSMTLIAARAAEVAAIDGPCHDLDAAGFHAECMAARRDGFNAKVAVSIEQVAAINAVFDRDL